MKKIFSFALIIYTLAIAFISSSYLLFARNTNILYYTVPLFLFINLSAGWFCINSIKKRLRICFHGAALLIIFQASTALTVVYHVILAILTVPESGWMTFLWSAIYCTVFEAVLFWNGILCVYFASYKLSLSQRLKGIAVGLVPILNLIMLNRILKTVFGEVRAETAREEKKRDELKLRVCKTRYPILLVHGVFFRDRKFFNYWGRIPKELQINGAKIYYGHHQSASAVANSAEEIAARIKKIIFETGCEKINIIAHSKGGLDCRYAIEHLGVGKYIASLTTVNTPHRGCEFAEYLLNELPPDIVSKIEAFYNRMSKRFGDHAPDFIAAVKDLTAAECIKRDTEMPLPKGIFCQSVGSVMNGAGGGRFPMNFSYVLVKHFNGANDGLVSEDSFEWGEKYTLLTTEGERGISHCDIIDMNREDFDGFDVRDFYINLVSDLRCRGF